MESSVVENLIILVLVAAILAVVMPWYDLLGSQFVNNPDKGRVYLQEGDNVTPCLAKRIFIDPTKGQTYSFTYHGRRHEVDVPPDPGPGGEGEGYPYVYVRGRRVIGARAGERKAHPVPVLMRPEKPIGEPKVSGLALSRLLVQLADSVKGPTMVIPTSWLLAGGALLLAGGAVWFFFLGGQEQIGGAPPAEPSAIEEGIGDGGLD